LTQAECTPVFERVMILITTAPPIAYINNRRLFNYCQIFLVQRLYREEIGDPLHNVVQPRSQILKTLHQQKSWITSLSINSQLWKLAHYKPVSALYSVHKILSRLHVMDAPRKEAMYEQF